ncbi:MAG TPA: hypothetical protein VG165_14895 [Solirubrobacteraceae bacterium]|jgi:hypothetical protein|nr:hypothetical protein [Solirubrobacteraceae bacterium]
MLAPTAALARKAPSPSGRHSISINVSENPVVAGDPLTIYGRLIGPNDAGRTVTLWHRVDPAARFTVVQRTTTDAAGFYAISRADGVVTSNRNWYVRSLNAQSRTVHENVYALVTLNGPPTGSTLETGPAHAVTFTGTASPFQSGDTVLLQRQNSASTGDSWNTIGHARIGSGGGFSITHTFVDPGAASIRVLVRRDARNLASPSSVLEYQIDQAQNPALTVNVTPDPLTFGQSAAITGVLAGGVSQPVTLLAHTDGQGYSPVAQVTTDAAGNYALGPRSPVNSTFYEVRAAGRTSAQVFEGVKDALSVSVSATTVTEGQTVTFSGGVGPDKTGHVIYLQRQDASGSGFHTLQVARVGAGSTYTIVHRVFDTGVFRVLIPGGPENVGAAGAPIAITVTPAPATALPSVSGAATVGSTIGG